jgi:phosphate transport system substrate-binding protein
MKKYAVLLGAIVFVSAALAQARDEIRIVGSGAVLPFVQTVAENFIRSGKYHAPSLEFTGTGNGFRLFGEGIGFEHPDIIATPRPITRSEFELCRKNGVVDITEIVIGTNGLTLVNAKNSAQYEFKLPQLYAALAQKVEDDGKIIKNPNSKWEDVHPSLPKVDIKVLGPPSTSTEYEAFMDLVMEAGCLSFSALAGLDEAKRYPVCRTIRKDGAFIESSRRHANAVIKWVQNNPDAFGIVPFSEYVENSETIAANPINGVLPSLETVSSGSYPLSRPLYLYVKTKHVEAIEGLQNFLYEFTSERAIGPEGYLIDKGFTPLDDIGRNQARDKALSLATMNRL